MTMKKGMRMIKEQILQIAVQTQESDKQFQSSLNELTSLCETAHATVCYAVTQKRDHVHPATYIGKGKLEVVLEFLESHSGTVDLIVCNHELSPAQIRNLSDIFQMRIIDRTQLILHIFAMRAKTKEGKLQVELAQLKYLLPRLTGQGIHLSRQGGGIGLRGPGETKLESDRRHIRRKIHEINLQLDAIVAHRDRQRQSRKEQEWTQIAIVGYTNAGKSTLFNRLTDAQTFEEDLLFATLDPTTRKYHLTPEFQILLTDTVGFIQDLPTTLVKAFRSTLEEVLEAHYILHVIDISNPNYEQQEETVMQILKEIGVKNVPIFKVYNKCDLLTEPFFPLQNNPYEIMSVLNSEDLSRFQKTFQEYMLSTFLPYRIYLSFTQGKIMNQLKQFTAVTQIEFLEADNLYQITGFMPQRLYKRYQSLMKKTEE